MEHRVPVWLACLLAIQLSACSGRTEPQLSPGPGYPPTGGYSYLNEATAPPPAASPTADAPTARPGMARLLNTQVGYTLEYPAEWQIRGQVLATEFAEGASCESVQIVDFQPPEGSLAAALHSFVQICARPLQNSLTLDEFMGQTYGQALSSAFEVVEFAGAHAYRTVKEGANATIFLQTKGHRIQAVSAVSADKDMEILRSAQVTAVLDSINLIP